MLYKGQRLYANCCADPPDKRLFVRCICHGIAPFGVSVGPMLRENYYLQLVLGGEALFDSRKVGRGDFFLMKPGAPHWLTVTSKESFEQYWFEVGGEDAGGLFTKVFGDKVILSGTNAVEGLCPALHKAVYSRRDSSLGFLGLFLTALSKLTDGRSTENDSAGQYVFRAMEFLRMNCKEKVTASDAAAEVGLSEKYLCRLFREKTGTTPTGFLRTCRLSQAKALLADTDLSISEVAAAVGFDDQPYFSRFFKECCGISPSGFRSAAKKTFTDEKSPK